MYPVILEIGPLTIYSYGLMMAIAFLVGGHLGSLELPRKGLPAEAASSIVVSAAVGGLVGARLLAILDDWSGFLADPMAAIFTGSGFVFFGGLIGGFLAVTWTIRRYQLPWLPTVDCVAPSLAIGHALGRIGCELAGDGDWGVTTTLPWGRAYPNAIIGWDYPPGVYVHPTPIYEAIAYSALFAFLWSIRKRPYPDGTIFWLYLLLSSIARFSIEFIRINPRLAFGLSEAQLISIVLAIIGTTMLLLNRAHGARAPAIAK